MPTPPRMLTHNGVTRTLAKWAELTKIPVATIRSRIDQQGYTVADALSTPVKRKYDPRRNKVEVPAAKPCPALQRHASGQACCRWQSRGKEQIRYFGVWGEPATAEAYRRFQIEWATRSAPQSKLAPGEALLVADLIQRYLGHVRAYYQKDGKPTSEVHGQKVALRVLNQTCGTLGAEEFRPRDLRACQDAMIAKGWARKSINQHTWRIRACFSWGVGQELVHPDVYARLMHVEKLQPGRSAAKDRPPKRSAPRADVEKTLPHLHRNERRRLVLADMVNVHLLTGCRPHELCAMTADTIDRSRAVWCFTFDPHKNLHRGEERKPKRIWIGPKAQEILGPYLDAAGATGKVWVLPPMGEKGTKWTPVSRLEYARLIKKACQRAGVTPWTPHQLRHTRATEVEREYEDNEAAAAAIGDTPRVAAEVYVDPSDAVARRIALALG